MCSDVVMQAKDLRKEYRLYPNPMSRLKQLLLGDSSKYYEEFVALKSVTFELKKGEVLGVVGRNGAGKSTLLQLLCGTLTPSSGSLEVNGRIAALLELGAGFNPEFSGRENIYLSGSVMGLSRQEIEARLESIIDFSGIRPFIDQPVKTYSSGMYVRLAFSVATSVDPDILVIDEALSVGDGDFARRSFDRIMAMRDAGKTILFCSHALYQVEALCSRAIWLEAGEVVESGSPDVVVTNYQSFLDRMSVSDRSDTAAPATDSETDKQVEETVETEESGDELAGDEPAENLEHVPPATSTRILSADVSADGVVGRSLSIRSGKTSVKVNVSFKRHVADEKPGVAVLIRAASGQLVTSCGSWNDGFYPEIGDDGVGTLSVTFDDIPLLKGRYTVAVVLFCENGMFVYDEANPIATLEVSQKGLERGLVNIPRQWAGSSAPRVVEHSDAESGASDATENLVSTQTEAPVWNARNANGEDEEALLNLFGKAFGQQVSPITWRWKYRFAPTSGMLSTFGRQTVGFIGGMPRAATVLGTEQTVVQIGDVMVAPEARGILTKKGAFYNAMHPYLAEKVGDGLEYPFAFGFPTERSAKLGIKLGLYTEVDSVKQARWSALNGRSFKLGARALPESELQALDTVWQQMKMDAGDEVAMCARDASWLRHRYIEKPDGHYQLMVVHERLSKSTVGLIVLKDHGEDGLELIDMVGPKSSFPSLVEIARRVAARMEREWLFGWFTPSALTWCDGTDPIVEETGVVIPGSAVNGVEHARSLEGRWWLMGGDTDFR